MHEKRKEKSIEDYIHKCSEFFLYRLSIKIVYFVNKNIIRKTREQRKKGKREKN
jgi:hypothetical protein